MRSLRIVSCRGTVFGCALHSPADHNHPDHFAKFEIVLKRLFTPYAISIPDAGRFFIHSFCIGRVEYVQDNDPIDGRAFVELFPQMRLREGVLGESIHLTVENPGFDVRTFSCSILGLDS